jgi:hypothetical protein
MPQKTNMLDAQFNKSHFMYESHFVYCAARALDERLVELMRQPGVVQRWDALGVFARPRCMTEADARSIEQLGFVPHLNATSNPALLPVREFLSGSGPITTPFSIVWGNFHNPLRVVHDFQTEADLQTINSAVKEQAPLRWWRPGPKKRPCYLFGQFLWEIKPSEVSATERELRLLFLAAVKRERAKFERLEQVFSDEADGPTREPIPESVQILVWRRDGGKCVKCGSQERLEYDHIIPVSRGGSNTARNIQLLCEQCNRQKGNRV